MTGFDDLKLPDHLVQRVHALGYTRPTALQIEAVAVIARGTTAVGIASTGSGKTLAYGLGLAARLAQDDLATQALILRPTDDRAIATAETLHRLVAPLRLTVAAVQPPQPTSAQIAVASPGAVLAALQHSAIRLERTQTLIVDGASEMLELGAAEALETLTAQIPRDAQRVVLTAELDSKVEDWLDRHARRARRLTDIPPEVEPLAGMTVEVCAAPRPIWMPILGGLIAAAKPGAAGRLHCRSALEAEELAERLIVRGIPARREPGDEASTWVIWGDESASRAEGLSISWGTPPDLSGFRERFIAGRAFAFVEPRELGHLERLAGALSVRLSPLKSAVPAEALGSLQATRDRLREAATQRDLQPYMLLLEPLFQEFSPTQLAAAATALYREREPARPTQPLPAWTRLYFGVGRRDGVRPADLVGAITGETSVTGDRIGRIEIRDTHSAVEVAASVADRVIKGLATATIRGRPANVRVFRE